MRILNYLGKPVTLTQREKARADVLQRKFDNELKNALGFEISITTLTTLVKAVSEQKFFEIAPADYMPIRAGQGSWSTNLVTYRSYAISDDFESGNLNMGSNGSRLAQADAGVDSVSVPVINWGKGISWNLPELQIAAKSGNWDLVTSKEESRKKNYDLGIQQIMFLGSLQNSSVQGLLTQSGVTTDTTTITQALSTLAGPDLKYFCANVLDLYRSNCARTAWPTHFIIPESDYLGLAGPSNAEFHLKSTLQVLEETFTILTKKPFKILPCAYGDKAYNKKFINVGTGKQCYALLNYDEKSLRADLPVPYTATLANSLDNFQFQNAAYAQYTGVKAYRPLELYYFQF